MCFATHGLNARNWAELCTCSGIANLLRSCNIACMKEGNEHWAISIWTRFIKWMNNNIILMSLATSSVPPTVSITREHQILQVHPNSVICDFIDYILKTRNADMLTRKRWDSFVNSTRSSLAWTWILNIMDPNVIWPIFAAHFLTIWRR